MKTEELDLLWKLEEIVGKEREKRPYHLNLLDELWANEDAHTRILVKLLQYEASKKFIFLESFLCYLKEYGFTPKPDWPKIKYQDNRIDVSISDSNYCVIIENKINGAADQDKQIERYLEYARKYKESKNDIYLIYLTADGWKTVSEISLTEKAKEILDFDSPEKPGRFIALNYRDHVLRWLKKNVSACRPEEAVLNHAIEQYIDYLEGRFLLREREKEMNEKIKSQIKEKLNCSEPTSESYYNIQDCRNNLKSLDDALNAIQEDLIRKDVSLDTEKARSLFLREYLNILKDYRRSMDGKYAIDIDKGADESLYINLWACKPGNLKWGSSGENLHTEGHFLKPLEKSFPFIEEEMYLPEYQAYGYYFRLPFATFKEGEEILRAINDLVPFGFNFS